MTLGMYNCDAYNPHRRVMTLGMYNCDTYNPHRRVMTCHDVLSGENRETVCSNLMNSLQLRQYDSYAAACD